MKDRYGTLSIALHWIMLALLAAVYACIELRELYPRGSEPRDLLKTWHFMLGLTVFLLVWVRIAARWHGGTPPIVPPPPAWQRLSARAVHLLLYLLMILMPIAGWTILSAEGKPVPYFGLTLPPLVAPDKELAELVEGLHESAGTAGYWIIGLHAAAALGHHYLRGDDTLRRMMRGSRR
ncbi:MAG: cytochrome b [Steroidobacteraceae bacterium]|jgi:cytochrome b561|nr:cytochrome b [Steroidobacteraceae bacterium]